MPIPTTFLDTLNIVDVQQAVANTRVEQQARGLAVTPKPRLGPAVQQGLARERALQGLSLRRQQNDIRSDQIRFQRRLAPFAIGVGALDLGVNVLGGVRALQQQSLAERQANRLEGLRQQGAERSRVINDQVLDILARRRRQFLAPSGSGL